MGEEKQTNSMTGQPDGDRDNGRQGSGGVDATRTAGSWLYYDVHTSVTACGANPAVAYPQCCQLATPASTPNGRGAQIVELRGWLRHVDQDINFEDDPADFHYDLELDPEWTDQRGIDLHQLMRPGSIVLHDCYPTDPTGRILNIGKSPGTRERAAICLPLVHVELMSWHPGQTFPLWAPFGPERHRDVEAPVDWNVVDWQPPAKGREGTQWPWHPCFPSNNRSRPLQVGDYVRMVGALVTDNPHGLGDLWSKPSQTNANPARWTEMHPPDLIERIEPQKVSSETVCCIAVIAANAPALSDGEVTELDFELQPPPESCPDPLATAVCREIVDHQFTNFRTIIEGNSAKTGARIDPLGGRVHIHIKVRGESWWGPPGKFKALYRVGWVPGPPQLKVSILPAAETIMAGAPVTIVVHAANWHTGATVRARVVIDSDPRQFATDVPFDYLFHGASHVLGVTAPGYIDARIRFSVRLRQLKVSVSPYPCPLDQEVEVFVSARDGITDALVAGIVNIDGVAVAATNTAFHYTFRRRRPRHARLEIRGLLGLRPPDDGDGGDDEGDGGDGDIDSPWGRVVAIDYEDADLDFGF